jgi:hypothetical protein
MATMIMLVEAAGGFMATPLNANQTPRWVSGWFCLYLLAALVWSSVTYFVDPGRLFPYTFFAEDAAYALHVTGEVLQGRVPFRDFTYQYGILTLYVQAAWAWLFGNSPLTYVLLIQALCLINVVQLWVLLRRWSPPMWVAVGSILFLFPIFIQPNSALASHISGAVYPGLERFFIFQTLIFWVPLGERTARRSFLLGLCMGSLILVKFGGGFILLAAFGFVDFLHLFREGLPSRRMPRGIVKALIFLGTGFAVPHLVWVILAWRLAPAGELMDVLWPYYIKTAYSYYVTRENKFLYWHNLGFTLGAKPAALIGAGVLFAAMGRFLHKLPIIDKERGVVIRVPEQLLVPGIFFLLALATYAITYPAGMLLSWSIALLTVYLFSLVKPLYKVLLVLACLLPLKHSIQLFHPSPDRSKRLTTIGSRQLWLTATESNRIFTVRVKLAELEAKNPTTTRKIIGVTVPCGLYDCFSYNPPNRTRWVLAGFVRPYEEASFLQEVSSSLAVVLMPYEPLKQVPTTDPHSWEHANPRLSIRGQNQLKELLGLPIIIDEGAVIFPVRANDATSLRGEQQQQL